MIWLIIYLAGVVAFSCAFAFINARTGCDVDLWGTLGAALWPLAVFVLIGWFAGLLIADAADRS